MKTEFLNQFHKDLDKITLMKIKNDVVNSIINVELATKISEIKDIKMTLDFSSYNNQTIISAIFNKTKINF